MKVMSSQKKDKIVIVAEELYRYLYITKDIRGNTERENTSEEIDIQPVTAGEERL